MKRRKFLYYLFGTASISIPFIGCYSWDETDNKILAFPVELAQLCDDATVRSIGSAYMEKYPGEKNEKHLTKVLLDDLVIHTTSGKDNLKIREVLSTKIREDFKEGRIVTLNGWMLSKTEARQCGLYSLTKNEF